MGEGNNMSNHKRSNKNLSKKKGKGKFSAGEMKRKKNYDNKPSSSNVDSGINPQKLHNNEKADRLSKNRDQATVIRKRADPELVKYFTEISNLLESSEMDIEERATVCGNALLEASGKEIELATDMIISHTMQSLLEGCDLDQLCNFIRSCAKGFSIIATDKFGSHVAETALRSLTRHFDEEGSFSYIENPLSKICQVVVADAANIMCCCYGSHVLRSLLCLCKGVQVDSLKELRETKREAALAERLNVKTTRKGPSNSQDLVYGFPEMFRFLVRGMLNNIKDDIVTLRLNKFSSFVLQTVLKLSIGDEDELCHAISILLGFHGKEGKLFDTAKKEEIRALLEDTASSHLLEVIIEVAPESLYTKLLTEVFKGSLFEISSHHCGNFVVQALVSYTKTKDQIGVVWHELGPKFKELLQLGKSGVVASVLAASKRLNAHVDECSLALAAAVSPGSSSDIVPHLLFLDSFFRNESSWTWPVGDEMHVLGSLMLQIIFTYPKQHIQQYITSITSMDADYVFQMAKDARGAHVLEAFLSSDISAKLKHRVIKKLKDHFRDLALSASGSYTVEKCFFASNLSLKEAIAEELQNVQGDLSNTKHGPFLLRKLDIAGFSSGPERWKQALTSKQNIYNEFENIFGSTGNHHDNKLQASDSSQKSSKRKHERPQERNNDNSAASTLEADFPAFEGSVVPRQKQDFCSNGPAKRHKSTSQGSKKAHSVKDFSKPKNMATSLADLANLAAKSELSSAEISMLFKPSIKDDNEQFGSEKMPYPKKFKR